LRGRAGAGGWGGGLGGAAGSVRVRARAMQRRTARLVRSNAMMVVIRGFGAGGGGRLGLRGRNLLWGLSLGGGLLVQEVG